MSAEPASSARQQLHSLVDSMSDEDVQALLLVVETELAPPSRPLTPGEIARLEKSLEDSEKGLGIPHDEMVRRYGLRPDR